MRKLSFKWFGSLTNLSFRRSNEKSESKPAVATATLAPVVETTMDDMGAMRPRTTSYVRSSENYSHMGTLPRLLMKRRDKGEKGTSSNKKSKDKISRSQSQRPAGDRDRGPPRPTAASSKGTGDEAGAKADTGLSKVPLTDPKTRPEAPGESNVPNISPTAAMSPSGGSSAALQPETCDKRDITQAEETSSPPLGPGKEPDHRLDFGLLSDQQEEVGSRELTGGLDRGNAESIYW